ncbi:Mitochodrial transcription termination factor-related [Macleaya cordata]|uniref:Mitochodrial transcription termination factor-related n=1 Tax=Macleaya cordata TaxID=56857 RepID=A0A200QI94_MACCD|nr:Mitochodrial transcription termination factor-related [Macleaya cordata]
MVGYFINSIGLSKDEAITASNKLTHLKSTKTPDSVLNFFNKVELGLNGSDLGDLIAGDPYLFTRGLNTRIIPSFVFLETILGCKENVVKVFKKSKWLVSGKVEGEFGISRDSWMFTYAIDAICSLICRSRKFKLGFLMNEVGYDPGYIASHPKLLMYSLVKRVAPRNAVLRVLKEKKLIKTNPGLYSFVCFPETQFLKDFLLKYKDDIPDVYEAYISKYYEIRDKVELKFSVLWSRIEEEED